MIGLEEDVYLIPSMLPEELPKDYPKGIDSDRVMCKLDFSKFFLTRRCISTICMFMC